MTPTASRTARFNPIVPLIVLFMSGCSARNRLGQPVEIRHGTYAFAGESLEWWSGETPQAVARPVVVFLEGDGSHCQTYSPGLWQRFLTRFAGGFVLVRPRTLINATCETERWTALDFLHRVDDLDALIAAVQATFPKRPIVLLGHSAGAHVARLYAERRPENVAGIINLSGGYDELSAVLRELALSDETRRHEIEAFLEGLGAVQGGESLWNRTGLFWQQMVFSNVRNLWLAYRGPCLVLHGTDDRESVPWTLVRRSGQDAKEAGSSCELQALENVGHDTLGPAAFQRIDAWLLQHWNDELAYPGRSRSPVPVAADHP